LQTLEALLAESPVFLGLSPQRRDLIAGCGQNTTFERGERLFREGAPASTFYLVRRGRVALSIHVPGRGDVVLETLEPGEVVGWSWLFPPYRWHFDAVAVEDVGAVAFDGGCLRGKCDADPALGYDLMRRFAQIMIGRLQQTRLRLLDLYGDGSRS
jgi:CRP/FNR family transcriptional regulator, cyclic AMP receptor protein